MGYVARSNSYYAICDGDDNLLTTGLSEHTAHRTAQALADRRDPRAPARRSWGAQST